LQYFPLCPYHALFKLLLTDVEVPPEKPCSSHTGIDFGPPPRQRNVEPQKQRMLAVSWDGPAAAAATGELGQRRIAACGSE